MYPSSSRQQLFATDSTPSGFIRLLQPNLRKICSCDSLTVQLPSPRRQLFLQRSSSITASENNNNHHYDETKKTTKAIGWNEDEWNATRQAINNAARLDSTRLDSHQSSIINNEFQTGSKQLTTPPLGRRSPFVVLSAKMMKKKHRALKMNDPSKE